MSASLESATPLFLVGAPRSGTTFLAAVLNAHPRILMTNETAVFLQLNEAISKSRQGHRAGLLYGKSHHELWADHLRGRARELIESYYATIAERDGKTDLVHWGDKHPHYSDCLPFLRALYPDAPYVYLVRDPRDSACSIAVMNGWSFRKSLQAWKGFTEKYEPFLFGADAPRSLLVKYEDLVQDPDRTCGEIFAWLGVGRAAEVEDHLSRLQNADAHHPELSWSRRRDFARTSVARWRRQTTEAEARYAEKLVGHLIEKYGYDHHRSAATFSPRRIIRLTAHVRHRLEVVRARISDAWRPISARARRTTRFGSTAAASSGNAPKANGPARAPADRPEPTADRENREALRRASVPPE